MPSGITIKFTYHWREELTDLRDCQLCKESIFSNMYRLILVFGKRLSESEVCFCQSCHDLRKSETEKL